MDDRQLLRRYQHGDTAAFETLISRHEAGLLRYVARLIGSESLAQDVVQETLLSLIRHCRRDPAEDLESVRAWLFRVARNRATDLIKKESRMRARQQAVAAPEALPPAPDRVEHQEQSCQLTARLDQLPTDVVEVLSLKILQGLSYREISAVTGHSLGKVSNLVHQGLSQLATQQDDTQQQSKQQPSRQNPAQRFPAVNGPATQGPATRGKVQR